MIQPAEQEIIPDELFALQVIERIALASLAMQAKLCDNMIEFLDSEIERNKKLELAVTAIC